FILNILLFYVLYRTGMVPYAHLARVFFVWVSVFNLFVVSVFWSFMADVYTREQGRRLFGLIASGGSIGALLGGLLTSSLVVSIGFENRMGLSAAVLLAAVLCIGRLKSWVHREHPHEIDRTVETGKPLGGSPLAGLTHLFSSRYFLAIALMSVIANLLGTALYMFRAELIETAILDPDVRTRFFSNINVAANALATVSQMFLVKQVVTRFGIGRSLFLFPLASIVGFAFLALEPTLMAVAVLDAVRRGLGFGFAKPSTDMLYSVVTPEEKYKTKNAIDTAVYRGGDVLGTWTIRIMTVAGLGMAAISMVMLPFAILSGVVALWLGREYKRKAKALARSGVR
ncbi:MAG: MFS transporter, partial [Proteobacteria bacterium]|nr:MFS transporter [Pseudomonadota bacterium]